MKKIIIIFNHLQIADGVARTAISLANELCKLPEVSVTLCPLFRYNMDTLDLIDSSIKIKPVFKKYFRGLPRLVRLIPAKILHKLIFKEKYDIEIGYGAYLPIKIIASSSNMKSNKYAWLHIYDEGLVMKKYYSHFDKIVCVSKYIQDKLREELSGNYNIECAYNLLNSNEIIELGKQSIEENLVPVNEDKKILVSVGRLNAQKCFDRLLKCVSRLKTDGYSFVLWIVGDGPEREKLENMINRLNLENTVYLLGSKKNPHAYTSKADLFVCSSYYEGYSTACTEALMLGVPFISTDVSGAKEMVEEAECGLVVSNENDEELYLALKKVLENPAIVDEWKTKLENTKHRFSKENRVRKMLSVLELGD